MTGRADLDPNAGFLERLLGFSILSIVLGAAFAPALAGHEAAQRVDRTLEGWPVDAFTLVDQHGEKFTRERLLGRWTFVLVGDTRCSEPCTAALSALEGLTKRIYRTEAILNTQVVFVSLDPARDTPERLKKYLAPYDKRWVGATGSLPTLIRFADDLGVAGRSYGSSLALIGPQGFFHAQYPAPFDVLRLTADYLKTRARARQ